MTLEDLVKRADDLIALAKLALSDVRDEGTLGPNTPRETFAQLRSSSLAFLEAVFGRQHSYYEEFANNVAGTGAVYVRNALGVLTAVREDLAGGWVRTTRGLASAEVFSDFLEMAEHLLSEAYKDAAAVLIGSVLEEHLRQLAVKYGFPTEEIKGLRKADVLNADLAKAGAYNKLDQKNVTSWLDLRNKAAHGRYGEYTHGQVELLLASVRDFVARHAL